MKKNQKFIDGAKIRLLVLLVLLVVNLAADTLEGWDAVFKALDCCIAQEDKPLGLKWPNSLIQLFEGVESTSDLQVVFEPSDFTLTLALSEDLASSSSVDQLNDFAARFRATGQDLLPETEIRTGVTVTATGREEGGVERAVGYVFTKPPQLVALGFQNAGWPGEYSGEFKVIQDEHSNRDWQFQFVSFGPSSLAGSSRIVKLTDKSAVLVLALKANPVWQSPNEAGCSLTEQFQVIATASNRQLVGRSHVVFFTELGQAGCTPPPPA